MRRTSHDQQAEVHELCVRGMHSDPPPRATVEVHRMNYVEGNCPKCGMPLGEMPDPLPEGWICGICQEQVDAEEARWQRMLEEVRANPRDLPPLGERDDAHLEGLTGPPLVERPKAQRWAMYYKMRRQGR